MAVFAVSIKKRDLYFGEEREFGNTYHYETAAGQGFADDAIANQLVDLEKGITSSAVEFVGYTTWGPTDGAVLASVIRSEGVVSGPGLGASSPGLYKEACALVVIEIGRSPLLNRRRWLRKFIRVPGAPGASFSDQVASGGGPMTAAQQIPFVDYGNGIKTLNNGGVDTVDLVTKEGDGIPLATDAEVRPFLFTRQIGE